MSDKPFKDEYHLRRVAESAARACFVCYKPTSSVLVSQDGKTDFFYICDAHLRDASFAVGITEEEVKTARESIEKLRRDMAGKRRVLDEQKRQGKWSFLLGQKKPETFKSANSANSGSETETETGGKDVAAEIAELQEQIDQLTQTAEKPPRRFVLNKDIYTLRLRLYFDKIRAKRQAEQLQSGKIFPSVPTAPPGGSAITPQPPTPPSGSDNSTIPM